MKQIILDLKTGKIILEEVPVPVVKPGHILIKTHRTLVSAGTERNLIEFGKANILNKARQQPDRVKQVLDKIKTDGLLPAIETVFRKLDEPLPLGYSNAGEVIAIGSNVNDFKIGDRVVSNGHHAEIVSVPQNLAARIPEGVSYDDACFTVIASVALQGIRLIQPQLGEHIVVIGLGLIGLITCELLKANGCHVTGIDIDEKRVQFANQSGIKALNSNDENSCYDYVLSRTANQGADAVCITASSDSHAIISLAAHVCRKKGKIVLTGVIGLNLKRDDFYKKEIQFQVSASYGPGRYDDTYEEKGNDYPYAYARWTAKRNFEAILGSLEEKKINLQSLLSKKIMLADYSLAYENLHDQQTLGTIIEFPGTAELGHELSIHKAVCKAEPAVIGIIGAGNFSRMTLLPLLEKQKANIKYIGSAKGLHARELSVKYNIPHISGNYRDILADKDTDTVIITTRHDTHAEIVRDAIYAQKNILIEKPLCLNDEELLTIKEAIDQSAYHKILAVGFNRRYAPFTQKINELISDPSHTNLVITVNAGFIPSESWVHDLQSGGGRITGEACHFIDLASCICRSNIKDVYASQSGNNFSMASDNVIIQLKMHNGAQAVINYFSNGNKSYSKERIEVFNTGKIIIVDNFRKMQGFGFRNFSSASARQDKGHSAEIKQFIESIKSGNNRMQEMNSMFNSMEAVFAVSKSMQTNQQIKLL